MSGGSPNTSGGSSRTTPNTSSNNNHLLQMNTSSSTIHYRYSASTSDDDSGCVLDEYAWVPSGAKPDQVHAYFAALPTHKVPFVQSAGEQWRLRQLEVQLPPQDTDSRYCGHLTNRELEELSAFEATRRRDALGRGLIKQLPLDKAQHPKVYCHQCKQALSADELVIAAPERFSDRAFWHPNCFSCVECKELLVDLIYFKHDENVFCGRHHAEQIKPRCRKCDELIFSEECTEAEGSIWHMGHFSCTKCDAQLGGQRYVIQQSQPLCIPCYHKSTQPLKCNACSKDISVDKPHITQANMHWHADEHCFACVECGKSLLGRRYSLSDSRLFCGGGGACTQRRPTAPIQQQQPQQKVRFDLSPRVAEQRPPPKRSPPPLPLPSIKSPSPNTSTTENIYETVAPATGQEGHIKSSRHRRRFSSYSTCSSSASSLLDEELLGGGGGTYSSRLPSYAGNGTPTTRRPPRCRSADGRSRHRVRRVRSKEGRSTALVEELVKKFKQQAVVRGSGVDQLEQQHHRQNFYSKMPPSSSSSRRRRRGHRGGKYDHSSYSPSPSSPSSSSSSESDADDVYLNNYLASVSLPRFQNSAAIVQTNKASAATLQSSVHNKNRRRLSSTSLKQTPHTRKGRKKHSNCIVS